MIAILSYNAGNTRSVQNALKRLGQDPVITDDPDRLYTADKIIFPGVGEASTAMDYLKQHDLIEVLKSYNKPLLGICLGLQLMCTYSDENDTACLGIFDNTVKKFQVERIVPHMGWNTCQDLSGPLFKNLSPSDHFYFVHSYYATTSNETIATGSYGESFSAALSKDNYFGVQFHAEKSGAAGAKLLENFIAL